jgi:drug/metabolite transporter (DMT)-like permease
MRGPVAVASAMITQFPIFGVVLGLVVLRERPARHQVLGVLLAIIAITTLSAS